MKNLTTASTLLATFAVLVGAITIKNLSGLEERENACIADDDCGGIDTQASASSMSDLLETTTMTTSESTAPITAFPTANPTLSFSSPWGVYNTPITTAAVITAICSEATDGQIQCKYLDTIL
jgi:hypothetical protein